MTSPTATAKVSKPRELTGSVVRRSGDKTVAVVVKTIKVHPRYHKRSSKTTTYLAHDPKNEAQVGQQVVIRESRPISRRKRWIVVPQTA